MGVLTKTRTRRPSRPRRGHAAGRAGRGVERRIVASVYGSDQTAARMMKRYDQVEPDRSTDELMMLGGRLPALSSVFHRLRWGGRAVYATLDERAALQAVQQFDVHGGFVVERGPNTRRIGPWGLPFLGERWHYVVARKVMLIESGEKTDRFTFDVRLTREPSVSDDYVVVKTAPTHRMVVSRLEDRFPDAPHDVLLQRASKLVKRVFPVFLTREAAFLQLLHRDLPEAYRGRVPRALAVEKTPDGTVKKLYMSWLRLGGAPLSHLDFAEQSAELLRALHDTVGVIHLDLRLDNMVVHQGRVCFVDFGSSVRVGEDLEKSPMLRSLFNEMMQTSQIQRTMGRMKDAGHLTSDVLLASHGRVDKGVDLFYLALQLSRPYWNPDLVPFIRYDENSRETRKLKALTDAILRPADRNRPAFVSARDVQAGIHQIRESLAASTH